MSIRGIGGMILIRENFGTGRNTCPSDTLSATNNSWTDLGLKLTA
jgi:hypothetical protein